MEGSDSAPGANVLAGDNTPRLPIPEQSLVDRFCFQYLQLEQHLEYPKGPLLKRGDVQEEIFRRICADRGRQDATPRNARFQLRTLKELASIIQASISDEESDQYEVSDSIMDRIGYLVSTPQVPEADEVQMKKLVTYRLSLLQPPVDIDILENRSLLAAGGTTGLRTWEAALHLGQFLCLNGNLVAGKRVLELGAGTGYLSVLCAKCLGAAHVTATDGSEEVVDNLPENFAVNDIQWRYDTSGTTVVSPKLLKWGHALVGTEESEWNGGQRVDLVIGADITFDKTVIPSLVATLREILDLYPGAEAIIAATERNAATLSAFQASCALARLKVSEVHLSVDELQTKLRASGQHPISLTPFYAFSTPIRIFCLTSTA